jgi:hypothetical protein
MIKKWFDKHKDGDKNFEVGTRFLGGIKSMSQRGNIQNSKICGLDLFKLLRKLG